MIVCSCNRITDRDIELAVLDVLNEPEAPMPTPGVVYRQLEKRMSCCGCASLAVEVIYAKVEELERKGLICPYRSLSTREQLSRLQLFRKRTPAGPCSADDLILAATPSSLSPVE